MDESHTNSTSDANRSLCSSLFFLFMATLLAPLVAAAVLLYRVDPFDPAPFPVHELTLRRNNSDTTAPKVNGRMLRDSDFVGSGQVVGPEDLAYEPGSRIMYTGCADGWVRRVKLGESDSDSVVEDWVNTGGRPAGLAVDGGGELIVADVQKGLLKITKNKEMNQLANEAEGQRFKITNGVDVAKDETIYFTDSSYKYGPEEYLYDILGGRPYGRLLSFNPITGETTVLLRDLYYPNGVSVSPDHSSLIFCETPEKRCRRYWLEGCKKGSVEGFIDDLPGLPDNVHYDGQSNYLIAISSSTSPLMDQVMRHRVVRKIIAIMARYTNLGSTQKNGGIFVVDLEGNPTAHYYDPALSLISSGIKVENQLYIGSLQYSHIIRFNSSNS